MAALVVSALVLGLAPAAHAAKGPISPKRWATSFCTLLVDFQEELGEVSGDVVELSTDAAAVVGDDPSAVFGFIEDIADIVGDAEASSSKASRKIKKLGRPDVGGGAEIKSIISDLLGGGLGDMATEFGAAEDEFRRIGDSTTDPRVAAAELIGAAQQMQATFEALGETLQSSFSSLDDDPSIDPDDVLAKALEKAKACARIFGG
jgi:hypothetical protein